MKTLVLQEITKIFERRKNEIYSLLKERKDELKPELQHQMFGAMNEIDIFLNTLEYYREKEIDFEMKNAVLVGPMIRESMVKKFVKGINKKISDIAIAKRK